MRRTWARRPRLRTSSAVPSAPARSTCQVIPRSYPASANATADALPIPDSDPVTTAANAPRDAILPPRIAADLTRNALPTRRSPKRVPTVEWTFSQRNRESFLEPLAGVATDAPLCRSVLVDPPDSPTHAARTRLECRRGAAQLFTT